MIRKLTILLFALSVAGGAFAQLSLEKNSFDFGILHRADPNWTDFTLRNNTDKTQYIFRADAPDHVDVKFSAKKLKPDSSAVIRVAYSPQKAGPFKQELLLHTSAWKKPRPLNLSGESTFAASGMIPCPAFGSPAAASSRQFFVTTRQRQENVPLESAEIRIYKDGRPVENISSNKYGEAGLDLPYGRYFFSIEYRGARVDTSLYVNAVNDHLLAMLDDIPAKKQPVAEAKPETPEARPAATSRDPAVLENMEPVPSEQPGVTLPEGEKYPELPLSKFKENNLVFLVDISSSMKANGKLDLLKIAMTQLLDVLRPMDRFALVSYSSDTQTIIETENNLNKAACEKAIADLEAGGGTAGAKAINKAGRLTVNHFIENGNNQIILATDGSFDGGNEKAIRYAQRYKRKDVKLSVLGIKCGQFATEQMTELAGESNGRYIPIRSDTDAGGQLIEEIKRSALR
jgi:Ca-activated chloride channel family protein